MKTKQITLTGILTALCVALNTWFMVPLGIGDIRLDLGYIVFALAIAHLPLWGSIFVGAASAFIASAFFSAYGISWGWILGNIAIAVIGNAFYKFAKGKPWVYAIGVIVACFFGIMVVKTGVECFLYQIPLMIKVVKSFTAFVADGACLAIGAFTTNKIKI